MRKKRMRGGEERKSKGTGGKDRRGRGEDTGYKLFHSEIFSYKCRVKKIYPSLPPSLPTTHIQSRVPAS